MGKSIINFGILFSSVFMVCTAQPAGADERQKLVEAFKTGTFSFDARYRFESVDQENIAEIAKASTLLSKLGYKTGKYRDFTAKVEVENVSAIGSEKYNDGGGTASKAGVPVVADAVGTELNQAYLEYAGIPGTKIKYGRHVLNRGNQRFIGSVGWRQNDQTQDGVTITNTLLPDTEIFYGYAYNVNRIFGSDDAAGDFNTDLHMFDVAYKKYPWLTFMGYAYGLDISAPTGQQANSNQTIGLSLEGKYPINDLFKIFYRAEYADQEDYAENANDYDADYMHFKGGVSAYGLTLSGGYEELSSDNGNFAFRTPLATLHKFNGWADQFLTTPADGLEDAYVSLKYGYESPNHIIKSSKFMVVYHDFSQENGDGDYGQEWDMNVWGKINNHFSAGLKYANYNSDGSGSAAQNDVEKYTFSLITKF